MGETRTKGGWVRVCQTCYEVIFPTDYFPDGMDFRTCSLCGQDAMTVGVRGSQIPDCLTEDWSGQLMVTA